MPFFPDNNIIPNHRPQISSLDHLVLTVKDLNKTVMFYSQILGMNVTSFGSDGRLALQFGNQKINLHSITREYHPIPKNPTTGSADLCFVTQTKIEDWIDYLKKSSIHILEGPVARTGAIGPITSIYIQDPDENLIEIAYYELSN